jgi:hypothetical protein
MCCFFFETMNVLLVTDGRIHETDPGVNAHAHVAIYYLRRLLGHRRRAAIRRRSRVRMRTHYIYLYINLYITIYYSELGRRRRDGASPRRRPRLLLADVVRRRLRLCFGCPRKATRTVLPCPAGKDHSLSVTAVTCCHVMTRFRQVNRH